MSELALFLVRFGFMAVLWIFIFSIISVIRADLFGQRVVGKATERSAPTVLSTPIIPAAPTGAVSVTTAAVGRSSASASKLVVVEGESVGREIALTGREIHIGRAPCATTYR